MKQVTILISGRQGSGKTTLANLICNSVNFVMNEANIKAFQHTFAGTIYQLHNMILQAVASYGLPTPKKDGNLLQLLGTEWGRKTYGDNVWVNIVKHQMEDRSRFAAAANGIVFVVSDTRFPNELEAFPGAVTVRLECPEEIRKARILATPGQSWRENTNHPSETGLDHITNWNFKFDTSTMSTEECAKSVLNFVGDRLAN